MKTSGLHPALSFMCILRCKGWAGCWCLRPSLLPTRPSFPAAEGDRPVAVACLLPGHFMGSSVPSTRAILLYRQEEMAPEITQARLEA